jgi:hypothetical protein
MVGTSLAIFGTGVVSSPLKHVLPGFNPEKDNHIRYEGPVMEHRWIGGELATFDSWAESWAKMSGRTNVFLEVK